ncbi:AGR365Cp [Eremothecium gossypii ATCC 10895]|uniref:AGR365Cp n=1 Tax=Eremothecium gossypii (strain ATCC 10895 / CBS 109.51 / FGSC 9923 / NRRL Y-1056) TaxID=284811 RepID=Q74Z41_EREGS|nr:AGR365Cp [Eremothecium gossypii ATCC 10895]AAS54855.1 AGR365Cp [Eremothecium gossypii ATCC 10895]
MPTPEADEQIPTEYSNAAASDASESVECPVCNRNIENLEQLNMHLDVEHNFKDERSLSTDSGSVNIASTTPTSVGLASSRETSGRNRSHYKPLVPGKSQCSRCGRKLTPRTGIQNCRRCGDLFCDIHCRLPVRLDLQGEYDPRNGDWCKCCHACMAGRPGYNKLGLSVDRTDEFIRHRTSKNEDKQLRILQLENRLVRLVDGIATIVRAHNQSLFYGSGMYREITALQKSVTPWKENSQASSCYLCSRPFNLLLRKHHCKLCGLIVCENNFTNCSKEFPIAQLVSAATDLPFRSNPQELAALPVRLRVCVVCIRSVFLRARLQDNLANDASQLFSKYTELQRVSRAILRIMPRFEQLLGDLNAPDASPNRSELDELAHLRRKLLETFKLYDTIAKQIFAIDPANTAELKIQQAIKAKSMSFIQDKMLPLKNIPGLLKPKDAEPEINYTTSNLLFNNLTVREVKLYREQLMVLKEQRFIVEGMLENAKKQRRFEEVNTLKENTKELDNQIAQLEETLGDQGFV